MTWGHSNVTCNVFSAPISHNVTSQEGRAGERCDFNQIAYSSGERCDINQIAYSSGLIYECNQHICIYLEYHHN